MLINIVYSTLIVQQVEKWMMRKNKLSMIGKYDRLWAYLICNKLRESWNAHFFFVKKAHRFFCSTERFLVTLQRLPESYTTNGCFICVYVSSNTSQNLFGNFPSLNATNGCFICECLQTPPRTSLATSPLWMVEAAASDRDGACHWSVTWTKTTVDQGSVQSS